MRRRRGGPLARGGQRAVLLAAMAGAVGAFRKQRLDAADAAFPEAALRG